MSSRPCWSPFIRLGVVTVFLVTVVLFLWALAPGWQPAVRAAGTTIDLATQAAQIESTLSDYASKAGLKYIRQNPAEVAQLGMGPAGASAAFSLNFEKGDEMGYLMVFQFADEAAAAAAAAAAGVPSWWPQEQRKISVGSHDARGDSIGMGSIGVEVRIGWQCGTDRNLLALIDYSPSSSSTDAQAEDAAFSKALQLVSPFHEALVNAQICSGKYRILLALVPEPGGNGIPKFPLQVTVTIERRNGNQWEKMDKAVNFFVECNEPSSGPSLLETLRFVTGSTANPGLGANPDPVQSNGQKQSEMKLAGKAQFDADYLTGKFLITDAVGKATTEVTRLRSVGGPPALKAAPPSGAYSPSYDLLAKKLYSAARSNRTLGMMIRVRAAPEKADKPREELRPEDFDVGATLDIKLDRVAFVSKMATVVELEQKGTEKGKEQVALSRHAWEQGDNAWKTMSKGYPLQPLDWVSLGVSDVIYIRWWDGSLFKFAAIDSAISKTNPRVQFSVSPTQPEDAADRANYPDSVMKYLAMTKSEDPVVGTPAEKAKDGVIGLLAGVAEKAGRLAGKAAEGTLNVIWWGVEKISPPGVKVARIKSTAAFQTNNEQPQVILFDGELSLLGDGGQVVQSLQPGQIMRFDDQGTPQAPAAYTNADLAPGTLKTVEAMKKLADAAATPGVPFSGGRIQVLARTWFWVVGVLVIVIVGVIATSSRRKHARQAQTAGAPIPPPPPPEVLVSSSTAAGWRIARQGSTFGPYTWWEMCSFTRDGNLQPTDLVWHPLLPTWTRSDQIPGLHSPRA